jgi:hypothetical protein
VTQDRGMVAAARVRWHTCVIDSAGLGVRLYSPTSLARYSELLTMDDPASLADKVALADLIGRTEAPSDDPAEWLGGEPPSVQGDDR